MFRFTLILCFACVGLLLLAFPLSYFFQGAIYNEMSWWDYLSGGVGSLLIVAPFGSVAIFKKTLIATTASMLIIGLATANKGKPK